MIASLRRERFTVADMALARGTFDRFFGSHGIIRKLAPGYSQDFQIDEALLKGAIEKETFYHKQRALENDINSIRSIFELRRKKHPYRLEDSTAVLVTNNGVLAQAAYNYGRQYESGREVSAVITDFSLANVAWLKAPLASPDLPRLELIAECYATVPRGAFHSGSFTKKECSSSKTNSPRRRSRGLRREMGRIPSSIWGNCRWPSRNVRFSQ